MTANYPAAISALLIITAIAVLLSQRFPGRWRWPVLIIVVLVTLVPLQVTSIYRWVQGAAGELSIVTLILLAGFISRRLSGREIISYHARRHLYFLVLLTGFLLYPATLGLSAYDPYRAGFGLVLPLLLIALALLYWVLRQHQLAIILLIVVIAWKLEIMTSLNTWDYLLDPLLWLASPVILSIMYRRRKKENES